MTTVRVFVTGGTFDKEYDEIRGELYFKDTHLPEMLALGRSKLRVEVRTLMMIDSLEMTEDDRKLIVEQCRKTGFTFLLKPRSIPVALNLARAGPPTQPPSRA